jgi:Holliday junction resolvase RusA-like endonuclease
MTPLESVPPPGLLEFTLPLAPVSQQAKSEAKSEFKCAVQAFTKTAQYLLAGDVQLSVEWLVSEQARYETDRSPDVDNILKPLIDSLVGPDGLVIDDNQIQSVSCSWIDWHREEEQIRVELRFLPDEWLQKQGLVFVQFENGLCMPIQNGESPMGQ